MIDTFVHRRLSFEHNRESNSVAADEALTDPRLVGRVLIVLGDAGSGKSELLQHWGGAAVTTAKQLVNGRRGPEGRSFVDGLDEAAGLNDGDALDRVLGALKAESNTDFVLACRIADWRSASAIATIKSWTGVEPVELTIEPLGRAEIVAFLVSRTDFADAEATDFVEHYEERGLSAWLGNPQTLMMLAEVARGGGRPETAGALFEQFVDCVWQEHRKQSGSLAAAAKTEVLDALGAAFAALIIGGYDALTLAPGVGRRKADLPLAECRALPGIVHLPGGKLDAFLGSRLVAGLRDDRFAYQHRRVGEYLGARWLAEQATTGETRARLLGALRHATIVPSSLRGLWGWLADHAPFTADVIDADPLAVIEYGNADILSAAAAKHLLVAIELAEDRNEVFGWRDYHATSLVQPMLASEVERVLAVPGEARFWTQYILLRQMRDAATVARHAAMLRAVMLDEARPYATRDAAADALAGHASLPDWPALIDRLIRGANRDSLRLALVMMLNSNVGVTLSDAEFAETVYAYSGLTPRFPGEREVGTVALYYLGRRQAISDARIDGLLDALADCGNRYLDDQYNTNAWDAQRLFCALLERRLALGHVDPEALYRWLSVAGYDHYGGTSEARQRIAVWLQANETIRRALQRKVVDTCTEDPRMLFLRLRDIAPGALPTLDDVVALLDWLPEADARWRELIWFAQRREEGERARRAAARHIRTDDDRKILIDHADPPPLKWEQERAERQAQHDAERRDRRSAHRADYLTARERMNRGDFGALIGPAQVYMGRTNEVDGKLPAGERIAAWLGDDLQANAFAGFDIFLTANPPRPTASEIAETHARSRSWPASLIVVAALNVRLFSGRGFGDLSDERVQAGLLSVVGGLFDSEEWKPLRAALTHELEQRGVWDAYARLLIEPQLKRRANYPTGLWEILAVPGGTELAAEWLHAFPRIAAEPEEALIDHLMRHGRATSRAALLEAAARRRRMTTLDERRRRNWQAIELIIDKVPSELLVSIAGTDRDFLWVLRNRMGRRRRDGVTMVAPSPALLAAIITAFAPLHPAASMPSGVQTGDVNPWDASDFIMGCLDTLSGDPSAKAEAALATLVSIDNGYARKIGRSIADQHRAKANAEWQPHPVDALARLVTDAAPVDHADLQRVLLAELDVVQAKIRSSDADVRNFFYEAGCPKNEEPCSDVLVTLLRQTSRPLTFTLEPHLGGNREGDIWCESGGLAIAVECKRHWHSHLWTAFDWQLARQQAADWRARDYGIYIVYWFGTYVHPLTGQPRGSGTKKPNSPGALEAALRQRIVDAGLPSIEVKVLDVSRPSPSPSSPDTK